MEVIESKLVMQQRGRAEDWVLVPTMGALHAGHADLIRRGVDWARCRGGKCVVSLFVNPAQFNDPKDFANYPSTLDADLALCDQARADCVFVPTAAEIYQPGASIGVTERALALAWEGASRPGHFDGVCLVVTKLFHLTHARAAVFGEKDWQQWAIIRRMVRDLDFDLELAVAPTVREPDGLALSSRNRRLSPASRAAAPGIFAALQTMREGAAAGKSVAQVTAAGREALAAVSGLETDYLALVNEENLTELAADAPANQPQSRALFAGWLDGVRLIDNVGLNS